MKALLVEVMMQKNVLEEATEVASEAVTMERNVLSEVATVEVTEAVTEAASEVAEAATKGEAATKAEVATKAEADSEEATAMKLQEVLAVDAVAALLSFRVALTL